MFLGDLAVQSSSFVFKCLIFGLWRERERERSIAGLSDCVISAGLRPHQLSRPRLRLCSFDKSSWRGEQISQQGTRACFLPGKVEVISSPHVLLKKDSLLN